MSGMLGVDACAPWHSLDVPEPDVELLHAIEKQIRMVTESPRKTMRGDCGDGRPALTVRRLTHSNTSSMLIRALCRRQHEAARERRRRLVINVGELRQLSQFSLQADRGGATVTLRGHTLATLLRKHPHVGIDGGSARGAATRARPLRELSQATWQKFTARGVRTPRVSTFRRRQPTWKLYVGSEGD